MLHTPRLTSLALTIALVIGAPLAHAAEPAKPATVAPTTVTAQAPLPLEELRTFAEVMDRIKAAYVEPVDDKTLLENAIKGMLSNLDPHSAYLGPEDFQELQESTSGEFGGLGIEVGMEDGFVKVVSPIDDTPASRAGIEAGDLIVKIDGQPTRGQTMTEAVDKMRGKIGQKITLTLVRDGGTPFDVTLARAVIQVKSVKSQLLEDGYGYIRITQFQVKTGEEVGKALAKLRKDNGKKLRGLVLDLRNNPGGVLQAAVEVADHFLTKGLIVYTKGRIANSELRFSADPAYTPNGRSIQAQGIVPDIEVRRAKITSEQDNDNFKEADLQGHLGNGNGGADRPSGKAASKKDRPQDDDFQLSQALNLLKGLSITSGK